MTNISQGMSRQPLTRQQLELINRKTIRYPLAIAEKDYFLACAVQLIYKSVLKDRLIFKGGTALHHCYLPQKRFSEDLDFTSLDTEISLAEIVTVLEVDGIFQARKTYQSDFTIKIERLQFQGLLGQSGNIKLEIDFHQNVVLPGVETEFKNVWRIASSPVVMDAREICAEKIRAITQRARYRDFYDFYFLVHKLKINFNEAMELLTQKEIRSPIVASNIVKNWSVAKEQQERDLGSIYCSEMIENEAIEKLIENIRFDDLHK